MAAAHDRAGDASVDIEITADHLRFRPFNIDGAARIEAARQRKPAVIGQRQGFIEVLCPRDAEDGAKDFLAEEAAGRRNFREDGGGT